MIRDMADRLEKLEQIKIEKNNKKFTIIEEKWWLWKMTKKIQCMQNWRLELMNKTDRTYKLFKDVR